MAMFFALLSLYAYVLLLEGIKLAFVLLFAATTLLFHSQHIYVAVFFPVVFLQLYFLSRPAQDSAGGGNRPDDISQYPVVYLAFRGEIHQPHKVLGTIAGA